MEPEPEPEPVDSVAAVAAGVAAGAQQIDESMSDIGDLMADMFGAVAVAIDGQAQGGPRAVVAARRRQRELDEQEQRDREAAEAAAAAGSAAPRVPGATAGRAAVTTPPRAGGVAGARGDARSGAAASGCAPRTLSRAILAAVLWLAALSPSAFSLTLAVAGAAPSCSARVLQPGSPDDVPVSSVGSPRTPEPPPSASSKKDEDAKARQRAQSRAEELALRSAFAQEMMAVEKLRTPPPDSGEPVDSSSDDDDGD